MTIPLSQFDPSIAPHEIDLTADPEPPARVVPSTSRASTPRFPTRTRQLGTTLPWFPPARFPLLCRSALIVAHLALRTPVGVPFASLAPLSRDPSARSSPATIVWPPSPPLRASLSCLVGLTEPVRSAWRVTEHAFLRAPPGSSCSTRALRPSSNPLIRRRPHSCVSDVSHSSDSEAQGQGHNAKSTGYPQDFS